MAVISVQNVLNYLKAEDLESLAEPFYITDIRKERGERGRKISDEDADGEMYAFSLCSGDGEVFAHSKTATLGLMGQIDEFLRLGTADDVYGPLLVQKVGKARKFVAPGVVRNPPANGKVAATA